MLSLRSFASAFAFATTAFGLVGCSAATDEDLASLTSSADALGYVVTPDKIAAQGVEGGIVGFQSQNGTTHGYAIPAPYNACAPNPFAYKYIATIDATSFTAPQNGGFTLLDTGTTGFSRLRGALAATHHTLRDLSFEFGWMTLRESEFPVAQVNATADHKETRHYAPSFVRVRLREADGYFYDLLQATPGDLTLDISYKNPANCTDDVIHGEVAVSNFRPYSWGYTSDAAQQVASALIDDLMHSENAVPVGPSYVPPTSSATHPSTIGATHGTPAPTSRLLPSQRTVLFSFTGMQPSVRGGETHWGPLVGSAFTAGQGSLQAF